MLLMKEILLPHSLDTEKRKCFYLCQESKVKFFGHPACRIVALLAGLFHELSVCLLTYCLLMITFHRE
jgi:hypothetical protein